MIVATMLRLVEEAGEGVLVLIDGLEETEFARSRLTRAEVRRQLALMADTLGALSEATRRAMPELEWAGWRALADRLLAEGPLAAEPGRGDDAAWFAARSLVPATLSWLRVYRREQPALFALTA